jgi:hypothetical protein
MAVMDLQRVLVRRNDPILALCTGKRGDGVGTLESPVR